MIRPTIELSSIVSDGPKAHPQPDGSTYWQSTPCFVCDGPISKGEWISKVHGRWSHRDCARTMVKVSEVRTAWALIAEDIARTPRAYPTKVVRTVLEHLAEMVHEQVYLDECARDDALGIVHDEEFQP
jgi:hypothetical protein